MPCVLVISLTINWHNFNPPLRFGFNQLPVIYYTKSDRMTQVDNSKGSNEESWGKRGRD
jgi:hypothetical protein